MIGTRESVGIEWRPEGLRVVRLERRLGGIRWRDALTLPKDGDSSLGERLREALGPVAGAIVLGLPGHQGVLRRLGLPAEDRALLRPLLEFDLERHVPLPPEKVYFDFAVLGRPSKHRWEILLAATPKHLLDAALEALAPGLHPSTVTLTPVALASALERSPRKPGRPGLVPGLVMEAAGGLIRGEVLEAGRTVWQRERPLPGESEDARAEEIRGLAEEARAATPVRWALWTGEGDGTPLEAWARQAGLPCLDPLAQLRGRPGPAGPAYTAAVTLALQGLGRGPWRLDFLNPPLPAPRRTYWRRTAIAAGLLVAVLGAGLWLNQYRLERRALARTLTRLQRVAPDVQAVETATRRAADLRRVVIPLERITQEPSKLLLLQELTLLTPRHTWLTRLTVKRSEIELAGYSASAQELIPRLEASPRFREASFVGSIEREGSQERFTIRVRVR